MNLKKYDNIIIPLIAFCAITFLLYKNWENKHFLSDENAEFTTGKVVDYTGPAGAQSIEYKYRYYVYGVKYEGATKREKGSKALGKYYVVKYSKDKPKISELDLDQEVIDTLKIREAGFTNFGK